MGRTGKDIYVMVGFQNILSSDNFKVSLHRSRYLSKLGWYIDKWKIAEVAFWAFGITRGKKGR